MNKQDYHKSGISGHYDPVTDAYYSDAEYASLIDKRSLDAAASVMPEKTNKTKTAEPVDVDGPVSKTTTKD